MDKEDKTGSRIFKFDNGKQVIITKYKDHCYILNSFSYKKDKQGFEDSDLVEPCTSFMYWDGGNQTVEWGPPYGPISTNTACGPDAEYARDDFFIGQCTNDWSQLAVMDYGLPSLAINSIDDVFAVLAGRIA